MIVGASGCTVKTIMRLIKRKLLIKLGGTTKKPFVLKTRDEWFYFLTKEDEMEDNKKDKKKKVIKNILIFFLIIIIIIGLYATSVIVKKINVSKLGDEYCTYNGEHPIETGMVEKTRSMCRGCSKIMEFEITITDELCETCAQELHRCKRCGKLLEN